MRQAGDITLRMLLYVVCFLIGWEIFNAIKWLWMVVRNG